MADLENYLKPVFVEPGTCQWCKSEAGFVPVAGHLQCLACKSNVQPCCEGEK